ncbi:MAG: D-alanyl-D-alanine carboxypeptidase/D-alanyl-D-alanine-endopeptidase [Bacteroidales bacterium]|nr:D-alanyl-D-alanine carboxypeptidase/D-alanyl-D-alanine-endopeptidase [Bacteroidales bacterium]
MKNSFKIVVAFILFIQCVITSYAQNEMQKSIDTYCNNEKNFFYTSVAVSVRDLESEKIIAEYNANRSMTPASIVKLYTSAAALSMLGDDFRFKTTIGYTGSIDKNGTLTGDVVVIGGGDPTTGSKFFPSTKSFIDTIVKTVTDAGILKIRGRVVIDCSLYKDEKESIPKTWLFDDYGKEYAAGVFPVSFQDNIYQISIKTGNKGEITGLTDSTETNITLTESASEDSTILLHSNADDQLVKITGYLPPNRNEYVVRSAMPSPPDVLGMELHQAFFKKGLVQYTHEYRISKKSVNVNVLKEIYSPQLQYIVGIMNYYSSNNYAEHLVKYLGYKEKGSGTFSDGAVTVISYFKKLGVKSGGTAIYDGSGLSRTNLINANHMSEFLVKEYAAAGGKNSSFYRSLPTSGRTGTLRSFPFSSNLVDKIHAKTGSMTGVRNMAGYMETKSGKMVSFCVMFNGFFDSDHKMKEKQAKILEMIYNNY